MSKPSPTTLAKNQRIKKRRDFLRVQRSGLRAFGRYIVAVAKKDKNSSFGQVGITVPKKAGKAHQRNKIKRRIRHIISAEPDLFLGSSLVIIAKEPANSASFIELETDIKEACGKLKIKLATKFHPDRRFKRRVA